MTDKELKELKDTLWHSADVLRASAHLAANKYGQPILGLIFLRYADILYKQHKENIEEEYNRLKGGRMEKSIKEISIEKCGFYLPECAYYDFINDAPDDANKATLVKKAMEAIEAENPKMDGVLPKEVYAQLVPEEEPELLSNIVRIFKDIPENSTVDIFGEIYEYFLGNFALAEGKDGGTFYTPATVVRYMVEVLNPQPGEKKFLDPACGSGGMFVQAARYMHNHNASESEQMKFRCYGVEKEPDTVKLAKMNLLLNNIRGDITQANSFYSDPYNAVGQFDYVMANPPFNVDKVKSESTQAAGRLPFGMPGINKNKEIGNANYLWISYFYSYLNDTGRAGFVMASSATDSQGKDKNIRESLVKTGAVDVMVSVGNNFFYTKSLPCSLWFFDKAKPDTIEDKVLFIDARNYYTVVDRTLNEWTEWQLKNLNAIVWLYRGEVEKYTELLNEYRQILGEDKTFAEYIESLSEEVKAIEAEGKQAVADAGRGKGKKIQQEYDEKVEAVKEILTIAQEAQWLYEKFGDGEYVDVPGLCKIAYITNEAKGDNEGISIEDKGWSLTPGAYVGVVPVEDDGVNFEERMAEIHEELLVLQQESNILMETISKNMKEMGL